MKARSAILVQVQRQMTFLGLPVRLLVLAAVGGTMGVIPGVALELPALLLVGFALTFTGLWLWLFREVRIDPHFDRHLTTAPRFWMGHGDSRHLTTGGRS